MIGNLLPFCGNILQPTHAPEDRSISMAADIFAKIGDIKGESLDNRHRDEIEVLSWSWGVAQSGSIGHGGGGGGAGKASFNDFTFTHHLDKASPVLMKVCATGQHIPQATVTMRKAGKGQQEFLIIKMNDVIVTSVNLSASDGAATAEDVTLQFAKVDLEYKPQRPDGSLDAGIHFIFDIKTNQEG
jgi:type VI secretion system secreted protein Hcp